MTERRVPARERPGSGLSRLAQALGLPWWVGYAALVVAIAVPYLGLKLYAGVYDAGFPLFHLVFVLVPAYVLAAIHVLDGVALDALEGFRAVMLADEKEFGALRQRMITMPGGATLIAALLGLSWALFLPLTLEADWYVGALHMGGSPLFELIDRVLLAVIWTLLGVWIYHTIRQLRLVGQIYQQHARIDPFQVSHLYTLSRLSGLTAIAWMVNIYAWWATMPEPDTSFVNLLVNMVLVSIAAVTFIWPLWGVHRLLEQEKERLNDEMARRIKVVMAETQRRVDGGEYHAMGELKDSIEALNTEQGMLDKLPTWPWHPETLRTLLTAMLLPVVLWVVQRLLERIGI